MLSKNVNNKKCAPKLIFFNEKKIEKDSDNFWYRKLTLKVKRLGDFALFDTSPLTQFSEFNNFLWVCWFWGKNLSNFVPPVWKLHNLYCHNIYCCVPLPPIYYMQAKPGQQAGLGFKAKIREDLQSWCNVARCSDFCEKAARNRRKRNF